jgi:hypothetical protein
MQQAVQLFQLLGIKYANYVLLVSSIIIVLSFILREYFELDIINKWLEIINCFLIVGYTVVEIIVSNIFYEASKNRRDDFIDNSIKTKFSEENSEKYYSNDEIDKGIYKMAVNGFENAFFTYRISREMLKNTWLINAPIAIIFLFLATVGYSNILILFIQLSLPVILINQALKQTLFVNRMKRVNENYRILFQDFISKKKKNKEPKIIANVLEYETTLSWGGILFDTNIYNKLNDKLSIEWKKKKKRYNLNKL